MKAALQQRARELGFDACRVTTAAPPDHANAFNNWLSQGAHGEMAWLQRNAAKRGDPQLVLPGARSVICLAISYATLWDQGLSSARPAHEPERQSPIHRVGSNETVRAGSETGAPVTGVIARYARFTDYHDVLAERLKQLSNFIDQLGGPGTRSLWYVDTGPLLERDLAQRAGVGFVGKHTNLISRSLGNWIFLAEILTTLELEPDEPEKNRCGSCTRCLTACPTQAITAPFQLDARRCISYLTIELKGPIPIEFRRAIGNRIYGCDDCLAVCPWNKFAQEGRVMREHVKEGLEQPRLHELLALDDAGFKTQFAGTPMLRTKRRGILRNVCVALGNVGDRSALPHLDRASNDPEPLIAEHAKWAIEEIEKRENQKGRSERV